jgi:[CysO sulfur-carrier protein]-S-L-cysteine hydrolase
MRLPPEIRSAMISHAVAARPLEACGLLAVDSDGRMRRAYCLDNVDESEVSFTVDPDGHFAALTDAESRGWSIGGVFHSHPRGPASPSPTDLGAGIDPQWVHVIIGLADPADPQVRAWRIEDGTAAELDLV